MGHMSVMKLTTVQPSSETSGMHSQFLCFFYETADQLRELLPPLHRQTVSSAIYNHIRHASLLSSQLLTQNLSMGKGDHIVYGPMDHHDPLSSYSVSQFLQLLRALVMISRGNELTEESFPCEAVNVLAFLDFLSGKAIAISRKVSLSVWFV